VNRKAIVFVFTETVLFLKRRMATKTMMKNTIGTRSSRGMCRSGSSERMTKLIDKRAATGRNLQKGEGRFATLRCWAARESWYPGSDFPEHLDGSMVGDNGFDPLGLGTDPETLKWYRQAELQHCRWAMLGVVGILVPELLTKAGFYDFPEWNVAGAAERFPKEEIPSLVAAQVSLMGWAEFRRWADMDNPGCVNEDPIFKGNKVTGTEVGYPGGKWFDPLGYSTGSEAKIRDLQSKEIANGRLAMVAIFGFATQTFITGKGPIDNYLDHVANPSANTIFTQFN